MDDATFTRNNPITGKVASTAVAATLADANAACDAAAAALPVWSALGPNARRAALMKAAQALEDRAEPFVDAMMNEIGATRGWAMFNLGLAASMVREAAALTTQISGEVIPSDKPGCLAMALREPAGVILGIAPWNAPIILATRAVATPLAFGNTVVLKASEECPRTHAAVAKAIDDAGVPAGVVNLITNQPSDAADVVEELIVHPAVKRINFTGSTKVGRIIAAKAAGHLKRTLLELGGKAPFVVLADADLDEAASAANFGAFMNSGQICMSTERIVVDGAVAGALGEKLVARASALTVGDPRDPATQIGPVVNAAAAEHVRALIEDATGKGATLLTGGDADGLLVTPTIVAGVTPEMRIYAEESFGPVVTVIAVDGADEAVRVANDTEYGLSAAVFGGDVDAAQAVARQIQSGIVHVNGATVHDEPQMPFGGVKSSGWGRFGGDAAIDEFTDLRWMTVQDGGRHYPI